MWTTLAVSSRLEGKRFSPVKQLASCIVVSAVNDFSLDKRFTWVVLLVDDTSDKLGIKMKPSWIWILCAFWRPEKSQCSSEWRPGHTKRDLRCEFASRLVVCMKFSQSGHTSANSPCCCRPQKIVSRDFALRSVWPGLERRKPISMRCA